MIWFGLGLALGIAAVVVAKKFHDRLTAAEADIIKLAHKVGL